MTRTTVLIDKYGVKYAFSYQISRKRKKDTNKAKKHKQEAMIAKPGRNMIA